MFAFSGFGKNGMKDLSTAGWAVVREKKRRRVGNFHKENGMYNIQKHPNAPRKKGKQMEKPQTTDLTFQPLSRRAFREELAMALLQMSIISIFQNQMAKFYDCINDPSPTEAKKPNNPTSD